MSPPTTGIGFSPTTPAAPAGYANVVPQGDNGAPQEKFSFYVPNAGGVAAKTASYTAVAADNGTLLSFNSASAVTLTLPATPPSTTWRIAVQNIGTGALTVSPNGKNLDGAAGSLTLGQNSGVLVYTDGTNYFTERGFSSGGNITLTTTGTTGAATLSGGVLNIPVYSSAGGGGGLGITLFNGVGGLAPTQSGSGLTTAMNQSATFSATDETGAGIFLLDTAASATEQVEGILMTYPSSAFTLTAVCSVPGGVNYNLAGVVIAASTTGKLMFFGARWDPSPGWAALNYNSPTSFNGWTGGSVNQAQFSAALLGIRLKDDGTNITVFFSVDGYSWTQFMKFAKSSAFVGTFGYLGFVIDTDNGPISSTLLAWNITNP